MPSIGGFSFDIQEGGPLPKSGQGLEVEERPGFAGYFMRQTGSRAAPTTWKMIRFDASATLYTLVNALQAARGTIVTVVDQFAESTANVAVVEVGAGRIEAAIVNGVSAARLEVEVQLVKAT